MTFALGDASAFITAEADYDGGGWDPAGHSSLGDAIAAASATATATGRPVIVYAAIRAVVAHTTIAVEEIR